MHRNGHDDYPDQRSCVTRETIIDLSQDLPEDAVAMDSSPGAAAVLGVATSDPLIRAAIVLEKGKVVAKRGEDVSLTGACVP